MITERDKRIMEEVLAYQELFAYKKDRPTMDEFHALTADGWDPLDWVNYIRRQRMEARMDAAQARDKGRLFFRLAVAGIVLAALASGMLVVTLMG
jgi:hypothetical protein